eukprot:COSAG01_NODE_28942_length_649_cov_0.769091_1_plen_70_part_01
MSWSVVSRAAINSYPAQLPPPSSIRADSCCLRPPARREIFRCQTDCTQHPTSCINAQLYKQMADHLVADG